MAFLARKVGDPQVLGPNLLLLHWFQRGRISKQFNKCPKPLATARKLESAKVRKPGGHEPALSNSKPEPHRGNLCLGNCSDCSIEASEAKVQSFKNWRQQLQTFITRLSFRLQRRQTHHRVALFELYPRVPSATICRGHLMAASAGKPSKKSLGKIALEGPLHLSLICQLPRGSLGPNN